MSEADLKAKLFPPGAARALGDYARYAAVTPNAAAQGGEFCADIEHNVGQRGSSCSPDVPVLLTHGSIIAGKLDSEKETLESWAMLAAMEHFAVQGFRMFGTPESPGWPCRMSQGLRGILQNLSIKNQKLLAGNGMNLVTQSAFMFYVLANVIPLDSLGGEAHAGTSAVADGATLCDTTTSSASASVACGSDRLGGRPAGFRKRGSWELFDEGDLDSQSHEAVWQLQRAVPVPDLGEDLD